MGLFYSEKYVQLTAIALKLKYRPVRIIKISFRYLGGNDLPPNSHNDWRRHLGQLEFNLMIKTIRVRTHTNTK